MDDSLYFNIFQRIRSQNKVKLIKQILEIMNSQQAKLTKTENNINTELSFSQKNSQKHNSIPLQKNKQNSQNQSSLSSASASAFHEIKNNKVNSQSFNSQSQGQIGKHQEESEKQGKIIEIRSKPFSFIDQQTERQSIFKIIYLLEDYNRQLILKFQQYKNYLLSQQKVQHKYNLRQADQLQKSTILQYIRSKTAQIHASQQLISLYLSQKSQLQQKICQKKSSIAALSQQKESKMCNLEKLSQQLKNSNQQIIQIKQQKNRLLDEINRKKNNDKSTDSGIMDKLLSQYYENMEKIFHQDSVERINGETKVALQSVRRSMGGPTGSVEVREADKAVNKQQQ